MNKRAIIAMSGGVDSSVAAYLMKSQGYSCIGVTMKLFDNPEIGLTNEHTCCSLDDVEDAKSVAFSLGMPHYVFNFKDDFREKVVDKFISCYENALTPNPCIDCNRYLKFERLFQRAKELDYDYIVTGHYARVSYDEASKRFFLKKALDPAKDQSYVLYSLTQEQLSHIIFPLGDLTKPEVRAIASEHGFVNAKKHDSQDICFVPDGDYAAFIERFTGKTFPEGDFIDTNGSKLGTHKGIIRYTVGQRKGLGISAPQPLYVAAINPDANTVMLAENKDLFSRSLTANDINLISVKDISSPMRVAAKIRYRHAEQPATVIQTGEDEISVTFDIPQRAITKGQRVVLYNGDTVIGGGTITESFKEPIL